MLHFESTVRPFRMVSRTTSNNLNDSMLLAGFVRGSIHAFYNKSQKPQDRTNIKWNCTKFMNLSWTALPNSGYSSSLELFSRNDSRLLKVVEGGLPYRMDKVVLSFLWPKIYKLYVSRVEHRKRTAREGKHDSIITTHLSAELSNVVCSRTGRRYWILLSPPTISTCATDGPSMRWNGRL